jgi:hypothetical protein
MALCADSESALGRGSGFRRGLSDRDRELVDVAVRHGRFVACHALLDPDADQRPLWRARGRDLAQRIQTRVSLRSRITVRSLDRLAGGLRFLAATPTDRVLLIEIAFGLDRYARIAMLGHELQHAVEVAETARSATRKAFGASMAHIPS